MSFIPPPSRMDFEGAKARTQEIQENALHYAETHPKGDRPLETRPGRLLGRLRRALRSKRPSS
jgi:hypothetical protein